MKKLLAVVLTVVLLLSVASCAYAIDFPAATIGTGGFRTLVDTYKTANDPEWKLTLNTIESGPAVGAVFVDGSQERASAIWVYHKDNKPQGKNYAYRDVFISKGLNIDWRMRKDNDYSGSVTVQGSFWP